MGLSGSKSKGKGTKSIEAFSAPVNEVEYFHNERPMKIVILQECIKFGASLLVVFLGFVLFILLPLAVLYPVVLALQPSSLLLVLLAPCSLLYAAMLGTVAFRKEKTN